MTDSHSQWELPPTDLTLSVGDIHVWWGALDQPEEQVQRFADLLSDTELARAERYHFEKHKRRYVVSQGQLREILGRYLDLRPAQLEFSQGDRGKPALAQRFEGDELDFNMSHSHELALYAVTRGRRIGIDVEHIRPVSDVEQIVARYFAEREKRDFQSVPAGQKLEAFFNAWTRKEAYLKAIGEGLYHPLDRFAVSLAPGEPARLLHIDGDEGKASGWSLCALKPGPGYVAALAVEGDSWNLVCWRWMAG